MITRFLTKVSVAAVVAVSVVGASSFLGIGVESAQAASLVGPLNDLEGIEDLVVGSTVYDVEFAPGTYNSAFGTPTFLNDQPGAIAAVNAINTFFNSVNFGDNFGPPRDGILGNRSRRYLVPYLVAGDGVAVTSKLGFYPTALVGNWTLGRDFVSEKDDAQVPSYAVFTKSRKVPTPALLPGLFALGVGALRKRKQRLAEGEIA
jgi:hypothetical protein